MLRGRQGASASACAAAALGFGGWATSAEGAHPWVAGALYVLALVAAVGAVALWFAPDRSGSTVSEWREQEERFRRLNKNIRGHYDRTAGSRELRWSLWPAEGATQRDRELFEAEATHASQLLKKTIGLPEEKFVAWFGSNEVDQWLNAIRAIVHAGTDMASSGRERGQKRTGHFVEELPIMSAVGCVRLAAGVRPRVGVAFDLA